VSTSNFEILPAAALWLTGQNYTDVQSTHAAFSAIVCFEKQRLEHTYLKGHFCSPAGKGKDSIFAGW
jgi:hypothetical protein